ncbi:MAG: HEAT repeat domain-containing protein [Hydrogenophilales bacterium]|nr:HEAT repeat domain-containing protein [Hydrogenophilales bacterium]
MHLPDVLLFTAPACPHCPGVKAALNTLLQEGAIASLEVVDTFTATERVQALGVKSVPWFRIGEFEFEGAMPLGELRAWAMRAASASGLKEYFFEMLKSGRRGKVEDMIRADPQRSVALVDLMRDPEASMAIRLGIGAILEEFQGSAIAAPMAPKLAGMLHDPEPRNRADAAHFLSLIGNGEALKILRDCLDDPDPEVREIAHDALSNPAA